jgi:hypothetical protein
MKNAHDSLGGKKPVCNQSDKKWRDHSSNSQGTVGSPDLYAGSMQVRTHIGTHGHVPGSPYKIFQEHHQAKEKSGDRLHEI